MTHVGTSQSVCRFAIAGVEIAPPALPDREIAAYFAALADAVDLPLVVQDASAYVGRAKRLFVLLAAAVAKCYRGEIIRLG